MMSSYNLRSYFFIPGEVNGSFLNLLTRANNYRKFLSKFFELSVHKMSNFLRISACKWTMPIGLFAQKNHTVVVSSC